MKLAIDATTMIEGGGLKYLSKLIENFKKKDHSVEKLLIFVDEDDNKIEYRSSTGLNYIIEDYL